MRIGSLSALNHYLTKRAASERLTVYLIVGEVDATTRSKLFGKAPVRVLDGQVVSARQLSDELETGSLFGEQQAVYCRGAEQLSAAAREVLKHYCARPNHRVCLLLEAARDSSLVRLVEQNGVVVDLLGAPPWERQKQLMSWLVEQADERKKRLEARAAQRLMEFCEEDRALLAHELDKLVCFVGERPGIRLCDVEAVSVPSAHVRSWALGQAVLERNVTGAMEALRCLLDEGDFAPHGILMQLRSQMDMAFQLASAQGDLSRLFPQFKGRRLEHELARARGYGLSRYKTAIEVLAEADLQSRCRTLNMPLLLEGVVARLVV